MSSLLRSAEVYAAPPVVRPRDLRTPTLIFCTLLAAVPGPVLWALIPAEVVSPAVASDIMATLVFTGFLGLLAAPWLPNGARASDRWSRTLDMLMVWTIASAGAQIWELSFVAVHPWLVGVTADDTWAWIWWAYGKADTRYLIADPFVVIMEGFTAVVGGGIEVWLILQMRQGRFLRIAPWAILVGATQWYGAVLYFGIELYEGLAHVNTAWWMDVWIKFLGLNALWLVLPLVQVWVGFRLLMRRGGPVAT